MTALESPTVETAESSTRQWCRAISGALLSALSVILTCYLLVAALLAFVVSTAADAEFVPAGVLLAAIPGWLAAFQVPLLITGAPLSALPLLPTLLCVLLVSRASRRVARRNRLRKPEQALPVVLVMSLSHAVFGMVLAIALTGTQVPVQARPWQAFCCCGLLAACAATVGLADRCGMLYQLWQYVPSGAWRAVRKGLLGTAAVIGTGAAVCGAAVLLALPRLYERSVELAGLGDAAGAVLLALLYLPNAILGCWAFVTGTGVSFGASVSTPFRTATDALPPELPVFAVVPPSGLPSWTPVVFLLPVALGVLLGHSCRNLAERSRDRQHLVLLAVLVTTLVVSVPAVLSGGRFGGEYGPLSLRPLSLAATTFAWLAVPALVTSRLVGRRDTDLVDDADLSSGSGTDAWLVEADSKTGGDPAAEDPTAEDSTAEDSTGGDPTAEDERFPDGEQAEDGGEIAESAADDPGTSSEPWVPEQREDQWQDFPRQEGELLEAEGQRERELSALSSQQSG
ncbi:hypothetical protein SAMN04487904_10976 [Actinopolyspora lacussalsi subsp. righensis]|uniref:Uncharacterized protein n=1 Tax=Actinopolyspora righensis TaxID=995060 RepID=A0A1I7B3M5_9ACTN|nr:DUF6350 family protein [Actinopolyspora righensis]SFT81728.1 hypothetical protein SAMN04487904_10976 [Actinopolyspora righensis]